MITITQGILVLVIIGLSETSGALNYANNYDPYSYTYRGVGTVERDGCCHCKFNDTAYMNSACGNINAFMTLLQSLMMSRCDISDPCRRAGTDVIPHDKWFDFIVVGAGVAGPVIARRLSDQKNWRVLLVEAGPEEPSLTALPGLAFNAINSSLDWQYTTEPTEPYPTACLETGGRCAWPRGKMVSGTGGMYGMMYVRGSPAVYDEWARLGNPGWSYDELVQYFERAENPTNPKFPESSPFLKLNTGGPMNIDYFSHQPDFTHELLKSAEELGYNSILKDGKEQGFMVAPMLTQDGLRGTTSRYYLRPVAKRNNLYVLTNAHVTRILTEPWSKRAIGVELIDKDGIVRRLMTNTEVILTAGAIGSPQILLQSGIGPKKDLEKLGIPVVKDLPVGQNLQNHVSVGIKMTIRDDHYETLSLDSVNQYVHDRTGPVASTGLTQVTAFLASSFAQKSIPDIQIFFDGFSSSCVRTGLDIECPDGTIGFCPDRREIVARPTVVVTRSKGYLTLKSKNPLDHPLLYPNYFTNDTDMKILVEGVKKVLELTKTQTMKKWDLKMDHKSHPWCSKYHFGTDAYWECLIRAQTGPENHQSGTCRMGPVSDPTSVVDHQLRVHGMPNIRVADASIFPVNTNANPAAAIVMVAEKAADMIYEKYAKTHKSW